MDSLQKGFAFFKLAWQAMRDRPSLISPTLYTLLCGLLLTLLLVGLMGGAVLALGASFPGLLLAGFLAVVLIFGLSWIASTFSVMTAVLFYQELAGEAANLAAAWKSLRQNFVEASLLTLAGPGMALQRWWYRRQVAGSPPDLAWQEAPYLVIPTMAVETLPLANSLKRISGMVRSRLLRIGPELIGVGAFNRLAGTGLILIGALVGLVIRALLAGGSKQTGTLVGILVACLFILAAFAAGAYVSTVYHTSLYFWAHQQERTRQDGQPVGENMAPPRLLATVLSIGQDGQ